MHIAKTPTPEKSFASNTLHLKLYEPEEQQKSKQNSCYKSGEFKHATLKAAITATFTMKLELTGAKEKSGLLKTSWEHKISDRISLH